MKVTLVILDHACTGSGRRADCGQLIEPLGIAANLVRKYTLQQDGKILYMSDTEQQARDMAAKRGWEIA